MRWHIEKVLSPTQGTVHHLDCALRGGNSRDAVPTAVHTDVRARTGAEEHLDVGGDGVHGVPSGVGVGVAAVGGDDRPGGRGLLPVGSKVLQQAHAVY